MKKEEIKTLLNDKWYIQSGNLTPIYLLMAAFSGFEMKKMLGESYSAFLFDSKEETGQLYYRVSDLERLNNEFFSRFDTDPDYIEEAKRIYDDAQGEYEGLYRCINDSTLSELNKPDLYELIEDAIDAVTGAVGIGHMIEALAIPSDEIFKKALSKYVKDERELNELYILLTTPTEKSFAQKAEDCLREIAAMPADLQANEINNYLAKYGWMRNSYSGRYSVTPAEIAEEIKTISSVKKENQASLEKKKKEAFKKLKLPEALARRFEALSFVTYWQDDRKRNILIAIDYLERLLEELSRRTGVSMNIMRYAIKPDFLDDINKIKKDLEKRRAGSLFIATPNETVILTGRECKSALKILEKGYIHESGDIRGMAASLGTVIGKVKVCTTLESLGLVEEGDILVAGMTRPEYLPAMKKAAAFVTDEGGITCHAAIVAREMGKPCVIGTKNVTKILHDGDIVEVRGNHGIVIIKERVK